MLAENDRRTLKEAGIEDPDSLLSIAASYIREHPLTSTSLMGNALSATEKAFLKRAGAAGVDKIHSDAVVDNIMVIASEYAQLVARSLGQKAVAQKFGVSPSRIRQRISNHTLYTIDRIDGRVCPEWQFSENATLPGLEQILAVISKEAHPVAVERFFLNKSADLVSETIGDTLSPREWLMTGHPPEAVLLLAREL
ncbi:MAG: hypothetical protein V3W04_01520 [Gammaproteobacteria bacterium]